MTNILPVSCFIIAKNEADRIGRTIRSVRDLVDEVIVVDSGSTDATVAAAEAEGARVIFNAWPGFGQQKRFGEDQCRNPWVFNLDADEVVPPDLAAEIRSLFTGGLPDVAAFGMRDKIIYPGATKPRPFARDHYCYRLYDRRRVRFANSTLYDNVVLGDAPTGGLQASLYHHTFRTVDHLIAKCDERAAYNAAYVKKKSRTLLALRLVTEFPTSFLKHYFLRTHVFGGLMGFQYAMILSFYRFIRIVRLYAGKTESQGLQLNTVEAKSELAGDERRPLPVTATNTVLASPGR